LTEFKDQVIITLKIGASKRDRKQYLLILWYIIQKICSVNMQKFFA